LSRVSPAALARSNVNRMMFLFKPCNHFAESLVEFASWQNKKRAVATVPVALKRVLAKLMAVPMSPRTEEHARGLPASAPQSIRYTNTR